MRSYFTHLSALAAILSLSACATTPPNEHYLDAGARQHIKTVDAVLIAKQDAIEADVKRDDTLSQISGLLAPFSPIPVILEAGLMGVRTVQAENTVKPIRAKLEGHDYPYEFRNQIRDSLARTTLSGLDDFDILRGDEHPGQRGRLLRDSDADAVLFVDMKYAFSDNFETLYVNSYAMLFPNRPELKQFQETPDKDRVLEYTDNLYRNQFSVGLSTQLEDASTSEHAAVWAEMPPEKLVDVLDQLALVMADTIANDVGIDDLESDLNLIPEGYALNTKYDNHNQAYARKKQLETILDAPPSDDSAAGEPDIELDLDTEAGS